MGQRIKIAVDIHQ